MSKSLNNFYTLDDLEKKGFEGMNLRYFFLQAHYRQTLNFTWDALESSKKAFEKLKNWYFNQSHEEQTAEVKDNESIKLINHFREQFKKNISDDLQIPKALALTWEMIRSNLPQKEKKTIFSEFNRVFGLRLEEKTVIKIPKNIIALAEEREDARKRRNFYLADQIRRKIKELGYLIIDKKNGFEIKKNNP